MQRPGEDRGRQPSPLGPDWMPLCVGKRRTDWQINRPEQPNAQAVFPPHQRHARSFPAERSIAALRRTSTSEAQTRSRAHRAGLPSGLRPAPKGCLAPGQPECSEWATRRESSLLERTTPPPAHSAHDANLRGCGQRPRGSAPKRAARQTGPGQMRSAAFKSTSPRTSMAASSQAASCISPRFNCRFECSKSALRFASKAWFWRARFTP